MEERPKMKSIGIDIGSSSIKIVEVQSTSKGVQVVQFYEHTLSTALNADLELEVIEFLRDFTSKYDAAQTRFIFGLRQDRVAVRNKYFPFNDRLKISKSLAFELEEDLPFSSDNAIFDAKIIRTIGSGAEILACAAPKTHIQTAIQRALDAGTDPAIISAEGMAFANIFEKWNEPAPASLSSLPLLDESEKAPRHVHLIVNMGHSRTLVTAFEGNSLIAIRSILWGGKNIADSISRKYEIPYVEALKELQTKAFILTNKQGATFDQVTFSETIAKSVREMARDLQLSILELKSEFNAQISSIGLTGGASQIQNLGPFLTQMMEVPVNRISTLDLFPNVLFDRSPANSAKLGVALGLAIEGVKKPRNPAINFMRNEFAKQNHYAQALWQKWGHTVKVATAALVILFVYAYLREEFSLQLADRSQEALKSQAKTVAKLTGKNATENGIRRYIRENKKRATDLKTLAGLATMNSAMDIVKKISDATPAKNVVTLDVTSMEVVESQVKMSGYVSNSRELGILQQALANITDDGKVNAQASNLPPMANRMAFTFSFAVDRGIQKVTR